MSSGAGAPSRTAAPAGPPAGRRARNGTEEAIQAAARQMIDEKGYPSMTIDAIARRAFVSRTAVYFYFTNKRAVVDRLIRHAFGDMYRAAAEYLDGEGDPRRELHLALRRVVAVVNRDAPVLLLVGHLSGADDHLPPEWAPYIERFVAAAEARIARDQERGIAPVDIPARLSAQALLAMVERHITLEVIRGQRDAAVHVRALAELWWRAVYFPPSAVGR